LNRPRGRGRAIAQFEATILLVVVSLSLASLVYSSLRRETGSGAQPVFVVAVTSLGGDPAIERVLLNSSAPTTVSSLTVDASSSSSGVLSFNGTAYSTSGSICVASGTTFFSVYAPQAGAVTVSTSGRSWISGAWTSSAQVQAGWQEVMIQGGSSCSITLPGGQVVRSPGALNATLVSSVPLQGYTSGTAFASYIPAGGAFHYVLITTPGGFASLEI
jgi:hypothetical protein